MTEKTCTKCGKTKPLSEFHKCDRDGYKPRCKACVKVSNAQYRARTKKKRDTYNAEYKRKHPRSEYTWHLKRSYGVTLEEYDEMLEAQGGVCAICGKTPQQNIKRLYVDHCHATGAIRGLLCQQCNLGLGAFGDDGAVMRKAIKYLQGE